MTLTVEAREATKVPRRAHSRRPHALSAALLATAGAGLLLAACADAPAKRDDPALGQMASGGGNIPAPPSVDRSKCSDKGKQVVTADINLDKKPDVWKFFTTVQQNGQSVSVLSCKQVDLNHDGKVDSVYYYDETGGLTTLEEFDLDFDGKFEQTNYYVAGKKVRKEEDSNFDNRADVWTYLEDEKIVRIERDTDYNGKVDEWQYFEAGKLDRIGYDTTGSGRLDKWDRAPEGGDAQPGEGAGAAPAAPAAAPTAPAPVSTAPPPVAPPPVGAQAAKK